MSDWSSYDGVAARYDEVWGSRFAAAARLVWQRLSPARGARVLDIGTGTGILLGALRDRVPDASRLTGCDRSPRMIREAGRRVPAARFAAADAAALPFRDACFDAATAGFVMSHLADDRAGLLEARRVLRPGGVFAMTSWAADADPHGDAWRELLADAVGAERLRAASARALPHEARFESVARVENALVEAGFADVEVHAHRLDDTLSLDGFLADRELGASGRFARSALGADGWARFVTRARGRLERRFGAALRRSRGVLIGVGRRAE